jgi:hypothetical protein
VRDLVNIAVGQGVVEDLLWAQVVQDVGDAAGVLERDGGINRTGGGVNPLLPRPDGA